MTTLFVYTTKKAPLSASALRKIPRGSSEWYNVTWDKIMTFVTVHLRFPPCSSWNVLRNSKKNAKKSTSWVNKKGDEISWKHASICTDCNLSVWFSLSEYVPHPMTYDNKLKIMICLGRRSFVWDLHINFTYDKISQAISSRTTTLLISSPMCSKSDKEKEEGREREMWRVLKLI